MTSAICAAWRRLLRKSLMPNRQNIAASPAVSAVSAPKMTRVAEENSRSKVPFCRSRVIPTISSTRSAVTHAPMTADRMPNALSGRGIFRLFGGIASSALESGVLWSWMPMAASPWMGSGRARRVRADGSGRYSVQYSGKGAVRPLRAENRYRSDQNAVDSPADRSGARPGSAPASVRRTERTWHASAPAAGTGSGLPGRVVARFGAREGLTRCPPALCRRTHAR